MRPMRDAFFHFLRQASGVRNPLTSGKVHVFFLHRTEIKALI
jgi:hypothetical protein